MYRGLDPSSVSLQRALAYNDGLEDIYEREKDWMKAAILEALNVAFGENNDDKKKTYKAP